MDPKERLTLDDVGGHTLLAATHVHRYALAAELCRGLRVLDLGCGVGYGTRILAQTCPQVVGLDVDARTIEEAKREAGDDSEVEFEVGDALDVLRRPLGERFDCLVLFEVLEHLRDPAAALEALATQAAEGLKLVVSLPNSKAFEEENPHHVVDFGHAEAREAFVDLPDVSFLFQFHAEGSLIFESPDDDLDGRLVLADRGEPEYANHFIALANFGERASGSASGRMLLALAPQYNRYMLGLERAVEALYAENARLARGAVGRADAAAASLLGQLETARRQVKELRAHFDADAERERQEWIGDLHRQIEAQQQALERIQASRPVRAATAYRRATSRLKSLVRRA